MIKQLGQENVFCPHAIQARLKPDFPNIGQSGTFISDEDVDKDYKKKLLTAHNKIKGAADDDYHKEGE